jgi:large subunit ribosomal protein L4
MEVSITTLDQGEAGTIELSADVFGQPVRADILHQVVRWQLAKRLQGTHKSKTRGEIKATTRKMYKQKGTGRARHGAATATQFRGGGKSFGPKPRDHAHSLPKKVRRLGLKVALSSKLADGKLVPLRTTRFRTPTWWIARSRSRGAWSAWSTATRIPTST